MTYVVLRWFPSMYFWNDCWLHQKLWGVLLMFSVIPPRHSNNPSEDLFTGIIMLAVMLPGTTVTVIPTKSSVWGACVIVYHWVLSVIIVGIMALIQYPVTCTDVWELFSETDTEMNSEEMKTKRVKTVSDLGFLSGCSAATFWFLRYVEVKGWWNALSAHSGRTESYSAAVAGAETVQC